MKMPNSLKGRLKPNEVKTIHDQLCIGFLLSLYVDQLVVASSYVLLL